MNSAITAWAVRNHVSAQALGELSLIFGLQLSTPFIDAGRSTGESGVQALVRLEAAKKGMRLWRNNVGVLPDENGRPVRYGLGNDSKNLNKILKSGDLIGWRPVLITPALVGAKIAQFISRECKAPQWSYSGTEREQAQLKWAELINMDGGDAQFVTQVGSL